MNPAGNDTLDLLPHRPPFRFLSEIREVQRCVRGEAVWRVTGEEEFFRGHFPNEPIVPGVLITEALAQLSGIVVLLDDVHAAAPDAPGRERRSGSPPTARLAHVDCRYHSAVCPPAEIVLTSTVCREFGRLWQFDVQARVGSTMVTRGRLTLAETAEEPGEQPSTKT